MYAALTTAISQGRLTPGLRLPSSRDLSRALGVGRNTVLYAYDRLAVEGYVVAEAGRGVFVSPAREGAKPLQVTGGDRLLERHVTPYWRNIRPMQSQPRVPLSFEHDFFPGVPDTSTFPRVVWRRLCAKALRAQRLGENGYRETQGRTALREAVARHLSTSRAIASTASDVLVTSGTQQAIDLLCRTLVTPGRTKVAIENPGYAFATRAFEAAGAIIVPTPVDEEGLRVDLVPLDADIVFVTPSHQFPMGHALSPRRRRELIDFAAKNGTLIIEDDYQAEFPTDGRPADALQSLDTSGSVIYIGSFSKCMFPELRLGFLIAPRWALGPLLAAKQITTQENAKLEQDALAYFIQEGHLVRHVRKLKAAYALKRQVTLRCLETRCRDFITHIYCEGIAYITVEIDPAIPALGLARACADVGLRVMPLDWLYIGEAQSNGIVLGLGRIETAGIAAAVDLLADALRRLQPQPPRSSISGT